MSNDGATTGSSEYDTLQTAVKVLKLSCPTDKQYTMVHVYARGTDDHITVGWSSAAVIIPTTPSFPTEMIILYDRRDRNIVMIGSNGITHQGPTVERPIAESSLPRADYPVTSAQTV